MEILKKAGKAFEEAKEIIYQNKLCQEEKGKLEKLIFSKNPPKKELLVELEKKEKILEIASRMFLKEHNLDDNFMGNIEDWIKERYEKSRNK